jgi:F-type H+-transporting ATPase subunit alpha
MDRVTAFETEFHRYMETNHKALGESIAKTKELDDKSEETLKKAIEEFKKDFYSGEIIAAKEEKKDTAEAKKESPVGDEEKGEVEEEKGGKKETKSKKK